MGVVRAGLILAMSGVWLLACTDAGGNVQGGEPKFDAAPPEFPVGAGGADSGYVVGTGITFSDLYKDYFGRVGEPITTGAGTFYPGPGCAGDGRCHGDDKQAGALGSGGFVCSPTDKTACYMSLLGPAALLSIPADKAAPRKSYLISELRHVDNGATIGRMPKRPATFVFTETDIKRISDWIAAGAPNN